MAERLALHGGESVRREFLPFHRPWIDGAAIKEVVEALESGWITLSLPLYPRMTPEDIEDVVAAVKKVLAAYAW